MIRFQSYLEKRERYKSEDFISPVIMNAVMKHLFKLPPVQSYFLKNIYAPGMYEYVVSRTKFIDGEMKKALESGAEQVLIFGAGFDSRGIRFRDLAKKAAVFELDAPLTQKAKIDRYREKGIEIPANLVFIPIDFDRESIPEKLAEYGFQKGRKTLFILEGLTMYLQPESVDATFKILEEVSTEGSRVMFDHIYASVVRQENLYEGEKELYEGVLKRNEKFCFGIEKGSINEFLNRYGFKAEQVLDSAGLEELYFRDEQGNRTARVNGTHCLVTAVRKA
jgi:methyltransferase (TIGR00027 family)